MVSWILMLIGLLAPHTPETMRKDAARAIDQVVHEDPIYLTDDGLERSAAELVSLVAHESVFDPKAVSHDRGGESLGYAQVSVSNLKWLKMNRDDLLDPIQNLRAAVKLLRESHRVCRSKPLEEQLAWYGTGSGHCDVEEGIQASRRRMRLAMDLLRKHPPFWDVADRRFVEVAH